MKVKQIQRSLRVATRDEVGGTACSGPNCEAKPRYIALYQSSGPGKMKGIRQRIYCIDHAEAFANQHGLKLPN